MPKGVVDRLEAIEVQEQHADRVREAFADQRLQRLEHSAAIEQAR